MSKRIIFLEPILYFFVTKPKLNLSMKNHIPMKHVLLFLKQGILLTSLIFSTFLNDLSAQCQFTTTSGNVTGQVSFQSNQVDFVSLDIDLDNTCNAKFSFATVSNTFSTTCNFIEYYNMAGTLIATEDRTVSGSSTFTFNSTHLDGKPMARKGMYFFFRAKSSASATDFTAYKAVFISSVRDKIGPVFGTFPSDVDRVCTTSSFAPSATGGTPTATDACGTVSNITNLDFNNLAVRGQDYLPISGAKICREILRTWRATDDSGNNTTQVQKITVYDSSAPVFQNTTEGGTIITTSLVNSTISFKNFNTAQFPTTTTGSYYQYQSAKVDCENAQNLTMATGVTFLPNATDNCGIVGQAVPFGFEDIGRGNNPILPNFYNYDIQRYWVVYDECGLESYARRDYQVRDEKSPMLSTTQSVYKGLLAQLNTSLSNGEKEKLYEVTQLVREEGCTFKFIPTPVVSDNCAANTFITANYQVEKYETDNTLMPFSSGSYQIGQAIDLPGGSRYLVKIRFADPVGNQTTLNINIEVTYRNVVVNCNNVSFKPTITSTANQAVNFLDLVDVNAIVQAAGDIVDCAGNVNVFVRMKRLSPSNAPVVTTPSFGLNANALNFIPLISSNDLPKVDFNCEDIGKTVDVQIELVDAATMQVLATCTRPVEAQKGTNQVVTASFAVTPATTMTSDGKINILITNPTTQQYDITWMGPVSGSQTNIPSNFTIDNLPTGTYTISVKSSIFCEPTSFTIEVGTKTPLNVGFVCPTNVLPGSPTVIQLQVEEDFNNITELNFNVLISGVSNAVLTTATAIDFPQTSVSVSNNNAVITFNWTGAARNLTNQQRILSFTIDVPASATVGSNLSVVILNGTVEQLTSTGVRVNVPLQVATSCSIFVGENQTPQNLNLGGALTFMGTNTPVPGITATLTTNGTTSTTTTNSAGIYSFANIPSGANISVKLSGMGFPNAIDLQDIILLKQIIAGFDLQNIGIVSPLQIVAADMNRDGVVNVFDAVIIEQALVNIISGTPVFDVKGIESAWAFIRANQTLGLNTTIPTLDTTFSATNFMASANNIDYVGIKYGDLNRSALNENNAINIESRNTLLFQYNNKSLKAGEVYELILNAADQQLLAGLQMLFNFNPAFLQVKEVAAMNSLNKGSFVTALDNVNGKLPLLWTDLSEQTVAKGEGLIRITLEAVQNIQNVSQYIYLASKSSQAFSVQEGTKSLAMQAAQEMTPAFVFLGVAPNPFQDQALVRFELPKNDQVILTVWNLSGQIVSKKVMNLEAGYNELSILRAELNYGSGIYTYTLTSSEGQFTGKLVSVE